MRNFPKMPYGKAPSYTAPSYTNPADTRYLSPKIFQLHGFSQSCTEIVCRVTLMIVHLTPSYTVFDVPGISKYT